MGRMGRVGAIAAIVGMLSGCAETTTCTIVDGDGGERMLWCPDGTAQPLPDPAATCRVVSREDGVRLIRCADGTEAELGRDGTSCSVTAQEDGSATISCEDGTTATVRAGRDGSSCSAETTTDGTKRIRCSDGTSITVLDGADGRPCAAQDHGDGTKTITCPDGSTVTVHDGASGASCTVEELSAGARLVRCPDGTSALIEDGAQGADGRSCTVREVDATHKELSCSDGTSVILEDGSSCSVVDANGTSTISCTDGTSVVVPAGAPGQDGASCTVGSNGDGSSTIRCDDGTSVVVRDGTSGSAGTSCTVRDNGDGTVTLACGDGTTVTFRVATALDGGTGPTDGGSGPVDGGSGPVDGGSTMPDGLCLQDGWCFDHPRPFGVGASPVLVPHARNAASIFTHGLATFDGTNWNLQAPPLAVAAGASGSTPWVVGSSLANASAGAAAGWNGATWQEETVPGATRLTAVTVAPDGTVFAVDSTSLFIRTGGAWSSASLPYTGVTRLSASSSTDLWLFGAPAGNVMRWNGASFSLLATPGNAPCAVAGTGPNALRMFLPLVAGARGVWDWNGSAWSMLPGSERSAYAPTWCAASSPNEARAPGARWTGTGWQAEPGTGSFQAVEYASDGTAWAVSALVHRFTQAGAWESVTVAGPSAGLPQFGNVAIPGGRFWTTTTPPRAFDPTTNRAETPGTFPSPLTVESLWGSSESDVWAVGGINGVARWDGSAWARVTPPSFEALHGVWGAGPNDVWVVGRNTVARWNGSAWSMVDATKDVLSIAGSGTGPGELWLGTATAVMRWDGAAFVEEVLPALPSRATSTKLDIEFAPEADVVFVNQTYVDRFGLQRYRTLHRYDSTWFVHDFGDLVTVSRMGAGRYFMTTLGGNGRIGAGATFTPVTDPFLRRASGTLQGHGPTTAWARDFVTGAVFLHR